MSLNEYTAMWDDDFVPERDRFDSVPGEDCICDDTPCTCDVLCSECGPAACGCRASRQSHAVKRNAADVVTQIALDAGMDD